MSITIECPGCRAAFQLPDRMEGKRIRCKTCREEFRVTADEPADESDDDRPRRRTKQRSPLVGLAIVGGILAGCLVIAVVVIFVIARVLSEREAPQPFAGQPFPAPRAVARPGNVVIGQPQAPMRPVPQNAVEPEHVIPPPRPSGRVGRPASVPDGPMVVTLSNPRRAPSSNPGRTGYQVDYKVQDMPAGTDNDWYYLVVKVPAGIGETVLFKLADKPQGTISFSFFPGSDPGQGFEMWVERQPFGKPKERKKVSESVTLE
jgi:hypothetical protein